MTETELSGVTCRHSGPRIVTRREKEMFFFFTAIGKIFYVLYCIVYPHPLSFYHLCKRIISLPNTKNAQSWRAPTVGDRTKATILQSERL